MAVRLRSPRTPRNVEKGYTHKTHVSLANLRRVIDSPRRVWSVWVKKLT